MTFATPGRCSHTWTPGTLVAIGPNSPRNSTGASGFRSNVSIVLRPPCRNTKISDTSFVPGDFTRSAASMSGRPTPRPNRLAVPTRRKSRRVRPSQKVRVIVTSRKETQQRLATVDDPVRPALAIGHFRLRIQAQGVIDRRQEILGRDGVVLR